MNTQYLFPKIFSENANNTFVPFWLDFPVYKAERKGVKIWYIHVHTKFYESLFLFPSL